MLVCPQCQFENLTVNKFCQECGFSLTQIACPTCGQLLPLSVWQCDCGTVTGTTWWAVITTGPTSSAGSHPAVTVETTGYLDEQQRYQILTLAATASGLAGTVLDCQPLHRSPLLALVDSAADAPPTASLAALIPEQAQAYLALASPIVPSLHDAWCQGEQEILLLTDRSTLPLLRDWPTDDETSLWHILIWLNVTLDLWIALTPWQCCQSVLEPQNLRLAETELRLQRLYHDSAPPSLAQLGEVWWQLLGDRQAVQASPLITLFETLRAGKMKQLNEVRSGLQEVALGLAKSPTGATLAKTLRYPILSVSSVSTDSSSPMMSDSPATPSDLSANAVPPAGEAAMLEVAAAVTASPIAAPTAATLIEPPAEALAEVGALEPEGDREGDDMPTVVLPMQLFSLEDAGRTDIGRQREHNEDNFGIETHVIKSEQPSGKAVRARGLYILCDGMGGHAGGEVASALAVDTLKHYFQQHWQSTPVVGAPGQATSQLPSRDVIQEAIHQANKSIYDINQQTARSGSGRMGTTLVLALIHDTEVAIAHVGDSRLYRYTRKYGLEQLTVDHEVGQREIQRGVDPTIAYGRPDAYQLTQALGPRNEDFIQPDIQFLELNEDTLLLIASDGLTDNDLLEVHCQTHIEPMMSSQMNLDKGVSQLIDLANEHNGHDNITAIAIRAKVRPNLEHLR
jgi:protein phosphatase